MLFFYGLKANAELPGCIWLYPESNLSTFPLVLLLSNAWVSPVTQMNVPASRSVGTVKRLKDKTPTNAYIGYRCKTLERNVNRYKLRRCPSLNGKHYLCKVTANKPCGFLLSPLPVTAWNPLRCETNFRTRSHSFPKSHWHYVLTRRRKLSFVVPSGSLQSLEECQLDPNKLEATYWLQWLRKCSTNILIFSIILCSLNQATLWAVIPRYSPAPSLSHSSFPSTEQEIRAIWFK